MELIITEVFVLCLCLQVQGYVGQTVRFGCSSYTIHEASSTVNRWKKSKDMCEKNGSQLVSMENVSAELNFLKEQIQGKNTSEYFIGLSKDSGKWRWISDKSTVDAPEKEGTYPWAASQPQSDGNCAKMYFNKENDLVFDDIKCSWYQKAGYICERQLMECNDENGHTTRRSITQALPVTSAAIRSTLPTQQQSTKGSWTVSTEGQTTRHLIQLTLSTQQRDTEGLSTVSTKEHTTGRSTTQSLPVTSAGMQLTLSTKQQSKGVPAVSTERTLTTDTFDESPDVKASEDSSFLILIILSLLAVIILAILIIFFVLFARRRRSKKAKASLLTEQSSDRGHYLHSSTELTVHFSMSRLDEEQSTFKTVSERKEEYTYAVVDKSKRKSRGIESSNLEQGGEQQTPPDDGQFTDHPVSVESEERIEKTKAKEDRKDHVYAVVHIQQGKAAVCRDLALQEENEDAINAPKSIHEGGGHAELVNSSYLGNGKEVTNSEGAKGQNEGGEYLYAAVDKASKKQRNPQMPPPYRDLVYADMSHLPENNTGNINRANPPTVYAAISHQKSKGAKSRLSKESEDQETTYDNVNNNEL